MTTKEKVIKQGHVPYDLREKERLTGQVPIPQEDRRDKERLTGQNPVEEPVTA